MKTPPRLFAFIDGADCPETIKASKSAAIHSGRSGRKEIAGLAVQAFEKLLAAENGILPKDYILRVTVKVTPR
ncbi:UNVERIFIED_ORG: putative Fe-S cluster-containing protein [Methylobacterium sp. SuP10 SLI 274]|uniref:hypothetical protein n=1 Tax=Methylorubrum extorquens TaxID=408 RepID=UPI001AE4CE99|nr:hypothetical protein [Methylorubrum extorquens]MCP1558424.1 putative Fe-S cluster-containing protein [Methylorubrum extorquens]MDH6637333.1 putative Fe-S cluster-containing protein [Methylobacterium sp. SuP10 SLI 274]MDH6666513.1 putative Fe-S cluster-containing protein [Methylorubrum zatmanii]